MLSTPVQAAPDRVAQLTGAKRARLAVFAGAISVLAFAPIHAWQVLFVSFGLLVWLLDGCHARHAAIGERLRCAALTGFWFGFGYFLTPWLQAVAEGAYAFEDPDDGAGISIINVTGGFTATAAEWLTLIVGVTPDVYTKNADRLVVITAAFTFFF